MEISFAIYTNWCCTSRRHLKVFALLHANTVHAGHSPKWGFPTVLTERFEQCQASLHKVILVKYVYLKHFKCRPGECENLDYCKKRKKRPGVKKEELRNSCSWKSRFTNNQGDYSRHVLLIYMPPTLTRGRHIANVYEIKSLSISTTCSRDDKGTEENNRRHERQYKWYHYSTRNKRPYPTFDRVKYSMWRQLSEFECSPVFK